MLERKRDGRQRERAETERERKQRKREREEQRQYVAEAKIEKGTMNERGQR